jgi:type I restriction enzyme R subunit
LNNEDFSHVKGENIVRPTSEVLFKDDLREFLSGRYAADGITEGEVESVFADWVPSLLLISTKATRPL